jgi:hypothetical protein
VLVALAHLIVADRCSRRIAAKAKYAHDIMGRDLDYRAKPLKHISDLEVSSGSLVAQSFP